MANAASSFDRHSDLPISSDKVPFTPTNQKRTTRRVKFSLFSVIGLVVTWMLIHSDWSLIFSCPHLKPVIGSYHPAFDTLSADEVCHQVQPIEPSLHDFSFFKTPDFRNWSLSVLQAAVRVPSESYDDLGEVGEDPRWEVFFDMEKSLKKSFPLVHKYLELENINTHGLLYTWKGTNDTLKPALFMAHQDVVPVLPESRHLWDHDPYEAYFDGENIWGRGTDDMKSSLIAILEAVEVLLKQHGGSTENNEIPFRPRRTILLGFGFDEEATGRFGAGHISKHLENRYGPQSLFSIIDEGGLGVVKEAGVNFALPGVSENGMYDISIELNTPGGHSSIPPDHTAIGIIGALAVHMEQTPFSPSLSSNNPTLQYLKCVAANSDSLPKALRQAIIDFEKSPEAKRVVTKALSENRDTKFLIRTSQAIDIVSGGLKINALPEKVTLNADYRINMDSSVEETRNKVVKNALDIAHEYNVGVLVKNSEGNVTTLKPKTSNGYFVISDFGTAIEPAPVSPSKGEAWDTLAGTIRYVFENFAGPIVDPTSPEIAEVVPEGKTNSNVVVAPAHMLGNTDTQSYWSLTENIFRFSPSRTTEKNDRNIHTVNEYVPLDIHIEETVFYYAYILNL